MHLKFENEIYDLSKMTTIKRQNKNFYNGDEMNAISMYDSTYSTILNFENRDQRDDVLAEIWNQITYQNSIFDLDKWLETYNDAKKYNVF